MKRNILTAVLLLLCGSFVACNEWEQPEDLGTPPVLVSEDVSAFFKKHLPSSSYSSPEPSFNFGKIGFDDKECFLINSMEEFEAVAPPSVELPVIDFERHTLIIGQHWLGSPGFTLVEQAIDSEPDEMELNLVYRATGGASPTVMTVFYFWGLYAKLPEKTVKVDIKII